MLRERDPDRQLERIDEEKMDSPVFEDHIPSSAELDYGQLWIHAAGGYGYVKNRDGQMYRFALAAYP